MTREGEALEAMASALATLDVAQGLAERRGRTVVQAQVDPSLTFRIVGGRHPVVEAALGAMAGKASSRTIAISVRRRTRPACLAGNRAEYAGKSTFAPERADCDPRTGGPMCRRLPISALPTGCFAWVLPMILDARPSWSRWSETAAILNQAGERSLVILDEIGRGTATFDGLSIAWAAVEHLHDVNRCRALFATHFHELTALSSRLPRLANVTVKVKEWQG